MINRLKNLIDVKSIITLALTGVFCYLSIVDQVTDEFLTIYTVIISFYFGTQYQKLCPNSSNKKEPKNNKKGKRFQNKNLLSGWRKNKEIKSIKKKKNNKSL